MKNILKKIVLIFFIFISCGTGEQEKATEATERRFIGARGTNNMEERNEFKEIIIRDFSYGEDNLLVLELSDISIKLSNYDSRNEPYIDVKSKGLSEGLRTNIDINVFNKIFEKIKNLNIELLYSENHTGFDGSGLWLEIIRQDRLVRYNKGIKLWSPRKGDNNPEIDKLLDIYDEIKILSRFEEYNKLIKDEIGKVRMGSMKNK